MIISMVNSNCKFTHNPLLKHAFNEETDKDKYIPNGTTIAYIKSNFCKHYHEDYSFLANEGKTKKKKKKHGISKGSGDEFTSSITFGVIHEDNIYELRIFRKNTIGISGLSDVNKDFIRMIAMKAVDFINASDEELQIELVGDPKITLCNIKYHMTLPPPLTESSRTCFNMYKLKEVMDRYSLTDYWGDGVFVSLYIGDTTYYFFKLLKYGKIHLVKLYDGGKINICGAADDVKIKIILNLFLDILNDNMDTILNRESIPTRDVTKIEYEY